MKYAFEGFQQSKLIECDLDLRDAAFLRWFADFQQTDRMRMLAESQITYYWIQYAYVIQQLPIAGFKTEDSVRHYLKLLSDRGVLHKTTRALGRGRGSHAYFRIDPALWRELTEGLDRRNESGQNTDPPIDRTETSAHILLAAEDTDSNRDDTKNAGARVDTAGDVTLHVYRDPKVEEVEAEWPEGSLEAAVLIRFQQTTPLFADNRGNLDSIPDLIRLAGAQGDDPAAVLPRMVEIYHSLITGGANNGQSDRDRKSWGKQPFTPKAMKQVWERLYAQCRTMYQEHAEREESSAIFDELDEEGGDDP